MQAYLYVVLTLKIHNCGGVLCYKMLDYSKFYYVALFTSCNKIVVGLNLVFGDTGGVVVVSLLCESSLRCIYHCRNSVSP
jgi:hypothetical protein